ncbi:choice-of-anchor M domain-containing protein [Brachybacterium sp. Marseille-Q7125]|uniref:choice-of-anchor M domain-containing protein n=1 Tax=Brachybacterium sp. Marseille-Q7125 TaxID=2932815 RepID=UPI001FF20B13|nr:choice-of-anchor M domain-containing protein [Brachybacterium sp. Marseille-Q7125]
MTAQLARAWRVLPVLALTWTVAIMSALAVPALAEQPKNPTPQDPLILENGHVDAFNVGVLDDGTLALDLKEDVTGSHVHQDPANVHLHVSDKALMDVPVGMPGEGSGRYVLPQTQNHEILWPGWDTLETQGKGFEDQIDLVFDAVEGPGAVHLFGTSGFGEAQPLLKGGVTELTSGSVREQTFPAHTHANWVFEKPGVYTMTVKAVGTKDGKAVESKPATYTWTVGDANRDWRPEAPKVPAPTKPEDEKQKPSEPEPTKPEDEKQKPSEPEPTKPEDEKQKPSEPGPTKPAPEKQKPSKRAPTKPEQQERLILEQGHVDAFNVTAKSGQLAVDLKEDVTGSHVRHDPATVELHVNDRAISDIPAGWPGEGSGRYVLPQTQNHEILWPGWDTLGTQGGGVDEHIDIVFEDVKGPGAVHLFGTSGLGQSEPLLKGGATELTAGAVREQTFPAHTHANWVFEKPGVYTMTVKAVGTKGGAKVESKPVTYTWTVGDSFRGKAAEGTQGSEGGGSGNTPATGDSGGSGDSKGEGGEATGGGTGNGGSTGGGFPGGGTGGTTPVCNPTEVTRPATDDEVKAAKSGAKMKSSASQQKVSGSFTVPANSHVHPNWVFTAPGAYTVRIRQTATLKSGEKVSGETQVRFNVGSSDGVTDGHFDLGTQIADGKLQPSLKDDRNAPPKWVDPSSVTFALGDAAKSSAPEGIEFLTEPGKDVWMVPSAQVPGVPWVGANTMHPSVIEQTEGTVTWSLVGVDGPGSVAVFTSGNFGQVVGEKWFSSTSSAPAAKEPKKADGSGIDESLTEEKAAVGQVFLVDGKPMVKEVVGRTPSGEECALPDGSGKLARTGATVAPLAGGAVALLALGGAGIALARRRRAAQSEVVGE